MTSVTCNLNTFEQTESLGAMLAACCQHGAQIELYGDLGVGKTTLVRGFLHSLGHQGAVKSPTYTLVEPYIVNERSVYHFDLYRLGDPGELEYLGFRDYLDPKAISLIEWPQRGQGMLPIADIKISMSYHGDGRSVDLESFTERGEAMLHCLELEKII